MAVSSEIPSGAPNPHVHAEVPRRESRRLRALPFANFRAEWVWDASVADPGEVRDAAIVYFHGGGLVACGLNSHRRMVARIARTAGVPLLNVDYVLPARAYALPVNWGIARDGVLDPAWSPVNHHFAGLPPALIQVASTEVLRPDAERLAQRCAEAGVPVTLQIWDNAFHVFQMGADLLPDARDAIDDIGCFIRDRVGTAEAPIRRERTSA